MRPHLYGEQTGQGQAVKGSVNGLTAYLEGVSFRGIDADMECKSCEGHEVGSRRWGGAIGAMLKEAKPE